ncbi:MAG: metalloregulator ArsR/SmtB family transcription factor [Dehalococcoidia bacterium]
MEERPIENVEEQAALFAALADPTRLRLVKLLSRQREQHALCVNALAGRLGVSQPAVSQHLRVLRSVGLVKGQRWGYRVHYFMNPEVEERLRHLVLDVLNVEEGDEGQPCHDPCPQRDEDMASP